MDLWRITQYPGLTGDGGLHGHGRWNTTGRRVIYASEHPSLAMVEVMAHLDLSLDAIPRTLKLIRIEVARGAVMTASPSLATGWQANEPTTQAIGDAWLTDASGLLLPVPSAIVPHATNYLINPVHPQTSTHLKEHSPEPFWIDKRFLR